MFSTFFRLGQTIETFRGQGIYQKAVDSAIHRLNEGKWVRLRWTPSADLTTSRLQVHLFGEGKVNQPQNYPVSSEGLAQLPRFKWGAVGVVFAIVSLSIDFRAQRTDTHGVISTPSRHPHVVDWL